VNRVTIKSEIQNISVIEKLIDDLSAKYNIHADVYGKLLLAVVEGVNNAIVHGNKLVSDNEVIVEYKVTDREIEFSIQDSGNGFDYHQIPDPTKPENLERTHGRGIFLMNHLADQLEFNDSGNQVILKFHLS
jgi:serine/threonine-protein kinase RsbW